MNDAVKEARKRWPKKFRERVQAIERLFGYGDRPRGTERWCPQCERFHGPSAPPGDGDE